MLKSLFAKTSYLDLIKSGNASKIWEILKHHNAELDEEEQLALIERGQSKEISFLLDLHTKFFDSAQVALVKRGVNEEISTLVEYSKNLCSEAIKLLIRRGNERELLEVVRNNDISANFEWQIIALDYCSLQTALVSQGLKRQKSVSEIIDFGHHDAIMALLAFIGLASNINLSDDDRDKIIFRDNPEEIKEFFDNNWIPTEKAILHLIETQNHEYVALSVQATLGNHNPLTGNIIAAVLEKGDETSVIAMLRNSGLLSQLKRQNKSQEWLEQQILARGNKDEIAQLARTYNVSDYTISEILHRNVKQEIQALILSKNICDAYIYDLIDHQRYDLLENYARCVPNNPTFYLLAKYMKAHH